jgi:hypothetical protein
MTTTPSPSCPSSTSASTPPIPPPTSRPEAAPLRCARGGPSQPARSLLSATEPTTPRAASSSNVHTPCTRPACTLHVHAACARCMCTLHVHAAWHVHRRDDHIAELLSHLMRALPLPQTASRLQRAWRQTRRCSSSFAPRRRRRRPAPPWLRKARRRRRACSLVRSLACKLQTWTRCSPPSRSIRRRTSPPPRGSPRSTTRSRPTKHRAATRVQPAAYSPVAPLRRTRRSLTEGGGGVQRGAGRGALQRGAAHSPARLPWQAAGGV